MPRRKLRLEPNEQERKALAEIKRIHKAGGRELSKDEARELLERTRHVPRLPGYKARIRNGKPQYKPMGFGQWREYSPVAYWLAKQEAAYLTAIEKAKIKRVVGGTEARRRQGEETRQRIIAAWNNSTLPEHNRASVIARKLGVSARRVRQVIQSSKKQHAEEKRK